MRPWQHAKSSARKERDWLIDLPIHEFMDSTKAACPDLRHRMILHNADLGPELTARAFPTATTPGRSPCDMSWKIWAPLQRSLSGLPDAI